MIRRLIAQHIARLHAELVGMQAMVEAECYPPDTLEAEHLQLAIDVWQLKIEIWLAFLPKGSNA